MNFIFNKTVFFWLVAFSISLPIFLGVSSNGITIIQLWDRKDAFPIHISMPFIVILGFYYNVFRISSEKIIIVSFYVIFITISNFVYVTQLFLIFLFYYVFREIPANALFSLIKKVIFAAIFCASFHFLGYLINMIVFNLGTKGSYVLPFGFFIYQGLISYPPFMFIVLLMAFRLNYKEIFQALFAGISLLSQRTAALIYVSFFLLNKKYEWVIYCLIFGIILFIVGVAEPFFEAIFGRFFWRIESNTLESGRISNWSIILSELNSIDSLLFGPQMAGESLHNYWLGTTNHIGLIGLIFFVLVFFLFFIRSNLLSNENFKYSVPFLFWFILDTNVNSPLSQTYMQSIFCLFLISCEKWNPIYINHKSKIFNFKIPIKIKFIKLCKYMFLSVFFLSLSILYLKFIGFENKYFIHVIGGGTSNFWQNQNF